MTSDEENNKMNQDSHEVNEPDGVYQPQDPITFEKVWLMFQETDKEIKETHRLLEKQSREADELFKETYRILKEQSREADERFKETDRIVQKISKITGGLGNNIGEVSEEYFRGALGDMPEVAGFRIRKVDSLRRRIGKLSAQFDIVLFGDEANIVVEVKHKLQVNDVVRAYEKILPAFKQLYPEHCQGKVFCAVAGMSIDDAALTQALDMGLLVFTQSGQEVQVLNPSGFQPKEF